MITRLRPAYSISELLAMYAKPHDAGQFADHQLRIADTIALAKRFLDPGPTYGYKVAADLSCGDGSILRAMPAELKLYGDLAPHPGHRYSGPLEITLESMPAVGLYVCTETLEHLDQPLRVLEQIRKRTTHLLLSTPVDAFKDTNPEHYWAWDREGVESLLAMAGFTVMDYAASDHRAAGYEYCFGIWMCA